MSGGGGYMGFNPNRLVELCGTEASTTSTTIVRGINSLWACFAPREFVDSRMKAHPTLSSL